MVNDVLSYVHVLTWMLISTIGVTFEVKYTEVIIDEFKNSPGATTKPNIHIILSLVISLATLRGIGLQDYIVSVVHILTYLLDILELH